MRLQVRRVAVLAIALALTLGVLFGLQHWIFLTQTKMPLQAQLERMSQVKRVTLNLSSSTPSVNVVLGSVADLETTYQSIEAKVQKLAPGAALHIAGGTDKALTNASQVLSFPVEQGMVTGQFVEMRQDVVHDASNLHVTARIYVDSQNVYLALYDHDKAAYFIYSRGAK
ncbi:MAG: hypothetical protein M0Z66_09735 [Thermaerobacter sp.]|nr:hypothetical protein [Thermaerobacter sp.]